MESLRATPLRAEIEGEWANMLAHQLPALPPFEQFWDELAELFAWLDGERPVPVLPRAEIDAESLDVWAAPPTMVSWRSGAPLELIRFAGANRLLVDLDYAAANGRWGIHRVEPYALRRSRAGALLLFVVNDLGQLRSHRVDRIRGAAPTRLAFRPRYRVEF